MTVTMTMCEYEELKRWRELFLDFYREIDSSARLDEFSHRLKFDEMTFSKAMEEFNPNVLNEF